jgi:hypothetical protein
MTAVATPPKEAAPGKPAGRRKASTATTSTRKKASAKAEEAAPAAAPETTATPPAADAAPEEKTGKPARRKRTRKSKGPRFEDSESGAPVAVRKKRRRRLVDDDEVVVVKKRKKKKKKKRRRDALVKPSPPLHKTDPLGDYLAGQQVPCPVGCGGFSEIVRIATLESGEGEVWFECLSCAQRRQFLLPKAKKDENAAVAKAEEEGREINCPRHAVPVGLRRRGRQFVCPSCGVVFSP